jgi:L-2-hydroxyglutarate oxidase LhgO
MSFDFDIVIIGAGAVGLAIAARVAEKNKNLLVVEKNRTFGLETSSRNSEVIHGGLYYPENSLKSRFCVAGRQLLYELCERAGIRYKKTGKIIVAVSSDEIEGLYKIREQGEKNGVNDLHLLTRLQMRSLEPQVEGISALFSPSTGILDSHAYMEYLFLQAKEKEAQFAFNHDVAGIEKNGQGFRVNVRAGKESHRLTARVVINSSGLNAAKVAALAGIDIARAGYRLHYCKGAYFSLQGKYGFKHLVYPVPEQAGLGIHVTPSIEGNIRLGPNTRYVNEIEYQVDEGEKGTFYAAVKRFIPSLRLEDMAPDFAGMRPKLQGPGENFRDFVIAHETDKGLPGLINLIGIESPGLTSSLAIARHVDGIIRDIDR